MNQLKNITICDMNTIYELMNFDDKKLRNLTSHASENIQMSEFTSKLSNIKDESRASQISG